MVWNKSLSLFCLLHIIKKRVFFPTHFFLFPKLSYRQNFDFNNETSYFKFHNFVILNVALHVSKLCSNTFQTLRPYIDISNYVYI